MVAFGSSKTARQAQGSGNRAEIALDPEGALQASSCPPNPLRPPENKLIGAGLHLRRKKNVAIGSPGNHRGQLAPTVPRDPDLEPQYVGPRAAKYEETRTHQQSIHIGIQEVGLEILLGIEVDKIAADFSMRGSRESPDNDLFNAAAAKVCTNAMIAIISNPVNSTVNIATDMFKKAGICNPKPISESPLWMLSVLVSFMELSRGLTQPT